MFRKSVLRILPLFVLAAGLSAQAADTAKPAPGNSGTMINSAASSPTKAKYWVFRTDKDAVAIHIANKIGPKPKTVAYLMVYSPGVSGFQRLANIQVEVNGTVQNIPDMLEVDLVPKASGKHFEMMYTNNANTVKLGVLRYREGSNGRASSDLQVQLDSAVLKSVVRGNPCDEPLVDDMGEEEELEQDAVLIPLSVEAVVGIGK